jgi:hypothetical protein
MRRAGTRTGTIGRLPDARRALTTALVWLTGLAGLCACGSTDAIDAREARAAQTARSFERALHDGDSAAACALLAPQTREQLETGSSADCATALAEETLPPASGVRDIAVRGRQAMVALSGDTLFLSQFPEGWRVVAAGCVPEGDRPYRCKVTGG